MVCPGVMTGIESKTSDCQDNDTLYVLCAPAVLDGLTCSLGSDLSSMPYSLFHTGLAPSVRPSACSFSEWKRFSGTKGATGGRQAVIDGWILSTRTASSAV